MSVTPTSACQRTTDQHGPSADRQIGEKVPPDAAALSTASASFSGPPIKIRPARRVRWVQTILLSVVAGAVASLVPSVEREAVVTFDVDSAQPPALQRLLPQLLLDSVRSAPRDRPGESLLRYAVGTTPSGHLFLSVTGASGSTVRETAAGVSRVFQEKSAQEALSLLQVSTPAMIKVASLVQSLEDELVALKTARTEAAIADESRDPIAEQAYLENQWVTQRDRFLATTGQLSELEEHLAGLRAAPEPSSAVVTSDQRHAAMMADLALQQDLQEVRVVLTEMKLRLLEVWQRSSAPLDDAVAVGLSLVSAATNPDSIPLQEDGRGALERVLGDATKYREILGEFADDWTRELSTLRSIEVDVYSSRFFDTHAILRRRLADFAFQAEKSFLSIGVAMDDLGDSTQNQARYHVLLSHLKQQFARLRRAHGRLLSHARTIEPESNFRLDAPLRAARGLRRRSQARIQRIDAALLREAIARARRQRANEITETDHMLRQIRKAQEQSMVALLDVQQEMRAFSKDVQDRIRVESARSTLDPIIAARHNELARLRQEGEQLEKDRPLAVGETPVTQDSLVLRQQSPSIVRRAQIGLTTFLVALAALTFAQWRFARVNG